jgi:hypothetical protein
MSDPRRESILWGHMLDKARHWSAGAPSADEDAAVDGVAYRYPAGMGFLMSSALVRRLTAPGVRLLHRIAYPLDDVLHGAWVADHAPGTDILDDPAGFHDVGARGGRE